MRSATTMRRRASSMRSLLSSRTVERMLGSSHVLGRAGFWVDSILLIRWLIRWLMRGCVVDESLLDNELVMRGRVGRLSCSTDIRAANVILSSDGRTAERMYSTAFRSVDRGGGGRVGETQGGWHGRGTSACSLVCPALCALANVAAGAPVHLHVRPKVEPRPS